MCLSTLKARPQGLESHLRGQLLLVCGNEETTVSGGVPCGGSGDEDSVVGSVLGCVVV